MVFHVKPESLFSLHCVLGLVKWLHLLDHPEHLPIPSSFRVDGDLKRHYNTIHWSTDTSVVIAARVVVLLQLPALPSFIIIRPPGHGHAFIYNLLDYTPLSTLKLLNRTFPVVFKLFTL